MRGTQTPRARILRRNLQMKKVLAIVLALLMVLSFASLAACGEKQEETKPADDQQTTTTPVDGEVTEEVLKASKNNEYIKEKLAAGWELKIDWSLLQDNYFTSTQLAAASEDMFEAEGFARGTVYAAADGNIADQITQLENIMTVGEAVGVCVQTGDPNAVQTVVEQMQDFGICVVIYGIQVEYDTIVAMADVYNAGWGAAVMASDWAKVRYPDEVVKTAVLGSQIMEPVVQLTNGMKDGVEAAENLEMAYFGDNEGYSLEDGYNGAEAALMIDGDIKAFVCYQMCAGLGVNNYLEAQGKDFSEYGIFATSEDDTTPDMLDKAGRNEGSFRGTIAAGGGVPDTTVAAMLGALYGEIPVGTTMIDPMKAWTSSDYTCDFTIGY